MTLDEFILRLRFLRDDNAAGNLPVIFTGLYGSSADSCDLWVIPHPTYQCGQPHVQIETDLSTG
jgi:hypothetical protein